MENGECVKVFRNGGMALIRNEDGFAVAEMLDGAIEFGEHLQGDWEDLGTTTLFNISQGCRQEVYLQGSWTTAATALRANGG